jgi:hypothetical protein
LIFIVHCYKKIEQNIKGYAQNENTNQQYSQYSTNLKIKEAQTFLAEEKLQLPTVHIIKKTEG